RAALAYGAEFVTARVDPVMVELLREALSRLETRDAPLRALVMARLAAALVPPDDKDRPEILRLARESLAMARRLGDARTLLYTMQFAVSAVAYMVPGRERIALINEFLALALSLNERLVVIGILGFYIAHLLQSGQRSEAEATVATFADLLKEFPQPRYQARLLVVRATLASFDGDLAEVERLSDEWLALCENEPIARLAWALQRVSLAYMRGDAASIRPDSARVLGILDKIPSMEPYRGWVRAALGEREQALQDLALVSTRLHHFPWLLIAGNAAFLLRDRVLAESFYGPLSSEAFAGRVFWGPGGAFVFGPTEHTLGDLALLLGRPEQARKHYQDALAVCELAKLKPLMELCQRSLAELERKASPTTASSPPIEKQPVAAIPTLQRDGEVWSLATGAGFFRLRDSKGVVYLDYLLRHPGREVHVLELVGSDEFAGDAGPVLDARAKEQYRRRLEDLRHQLEEANEFGDTARARRAQEEIEALAEQLASAVGLGGRDRKAASNAERARVNVQRRLKDAIARVAEFDPAAGRYLNACVKTGTYCSFSAV
ncbi:MAG TPA: hypothetical protein VGP93_09005, partial [Polyangiaceae bacterium]|nr:hypothetical protein [Polyangiaceae bacterium]